MNGLIANLESDCSEIVEVDPTGRYGRYNEILGKGASKIVYRAFDEYQGIEVAWNQVKLYDFLQSPEDLERLYCEIHLLKTLKHRNIMKFYSSWVDTANRNINFVTEMFTSGTLRQYRLKHKRVNIRAVKHWCRQILKGLLYLHSHDPPVIHRDLKCDNIFINGNQGEVKIGDLGLAAILRKSHADHCVGTPEFMAPEVYQEAYNELVDIYSFGMCVLEMVTFEYPYCECTHPAQIYKKVISGRKPDALYKVKDPEVRQFVEKCLATVSLRLSASELLDDPFLRIDDCEHGLRQLDYREELNDMRPLIRQPYLDIHRSNSILSTDYLNGYGYEEPREWESHPVEVEPNGIELFEYHDDEQTEHMEISIKGKRKDDGSIFLRLRIADKEGRIRNIYFPFDVETDTALSVATEMIAELDITDQDVIRIADMIDGEIASLVPEWRPGPGYEETPRFANQKLCQNCVSNHTSSGSLIEFLSHNGGAENLQLLQCCTHGCASMRGRFGEITFQSEDSEHQPAEELPNVSDHSQDIWAQHESRELTPMGSASHSDEDFHESERSVSKEHKRQYSMNYRWTSDVENPVEKRSACHSISAVHSLYSDLEDIEQKGHQELRWLKARFLLELRELRYLQLGITAKPFDNGKRPQKKEATATTTFSTEQTNGVHFNRIELNQPNGSRCPSYTYKSCPISETQRGRNCVAVEPSRAHMSIDKSFSTGSLLPHSIHRTVSLLVDAVDI